MLSLGLVGAVSAMAMGCLGFKGDTQLLGQIFGSAGLSAGKTTLFAPIELVRLRLQTQDPNELPAEVKAGLPTGQVDMPHKYKGVVDCVKQVYE